MFSPFKTSFFVALFLISSSLAKSQTLPSCTCGIQYTYDAAGNRTKQEYLCNLSGCRIAESRPSFQRTDMLYPNPTSGRFTVRLSDTLQNGHIFLTDMQGKVLQELRAKGTLLEFNISAYSAGVYLLRIEQDGKLLINEKVLKQ